MSQTLGTTGLILAGVLLASKASARKGANAQSIIAMARQFVGWKYVWGGSAPSSGGFDCSGLVQYVYARHGIHLPRVAEDQYRVGTPVRYEQLQPGDLIFQANTYKSGISHVGLYIGQGRMLHAKGRSYGIVIDSIGPFGSGHPGARRILGGVNTNEPPPQPMTGVAFQDLPVGVIRGSVRFTVGHDPYPHGPENEYLIEIDGEIAVRFPEAGVYVRFDSTQLANGEHVMKLVRINRFTGTRFISQTVTITTENFS